MSAYTINITGAFLADWTDAYADLAGEVERGLHTPDSPTGEMIAAIDAAMLNPKRVGRGILCTATMTLPALLRLREETIYRWEMNGGNGDPYGGCEIEGRATYRGPRAAALTMLRRIDGLLWREERRRG